MMGLISLFIHFYLIFDLSLCMNDQKILDVDNVGIFGGHEISIKDAPYMASLRLENNEHYCGASIVYENFVLTAAHCIAPFRKYKVSVGTDSRKGGKIYDIVKIIVHEKYDPVTQDYDVCVIKLKQPLEFGETINKIELAARFPESGKTVQVSGWGRTPDKSLSDQLLQVSIPIVSNRVCKLTYAPFQRIITPRMFCAGDDGMDSCEADSGGPLVYNNKQIGIVSFGFDICGVKPGVYSKIRPLRDWILDTMGANL